MANIYPFRPWRYTAKAGPLEQLATQPYDTIPPALDAEYRAASPHNLVWLILPGGDYAGAAARTASVEERRADRSRRGARALRVRTALRVAGNGRAPWCGAASSVSAISRTTARSSTGTSARSTRPKTDRLELLRHTQAQFGSIFMMYPDAAGAVDRLLDAVIEETRSRVLAIINGPHIRCGASRIPVGSARSRVRCATSR